MSSQRGELALEQPPLGVVVREPERPHVRVARLPHPPEPAEQLALRQKYRINLIGVKRADSAGRDGAPPHYVTIAPQPGDTIQPDDLLLLVGPDSALANLPK